MKSLSGTNRFRDKWSLDANLYLGIYETTNVEVKEYRKLRLQRQGNPAMTVNPEYQHSPYRKKG